MDIQSHDGDPNLALRRMRDWLANVSRRMLPSSDKLVRLFDAFRADLPRLAVDLEFDPAVLPYVDFERIVVGWLLQKQPLA